MLKVNDPAPSFALPDQDGKVVELASFRGRKVLVYFYPKDDTPGCTKEACSLRDGFSDLESLGLAVLGISPDSPESHAAFAAKYRLPFRLLSDPDHAVLEAYGAWGEKKNYGRVYQGVLRSSFLIDESGVVKAVVAKVDTENHAAQIAALLGA